MSGDDANHGRNQQHRPYWEKACEDHYQRLISSASRLANGKVYDAEELVQETVCRALIFSGNPDEIRNPLAYLLRMLRNVWTDKWNRENTANMESLDIPQSKNVHHSRAQAVEPAVEPDILRILENKELREKVSDKQGPLTPREELLLTLHLKGYKCKDIAAMLNEDVRLIRSDLNAVRAKVRYRLTKAKAKTTA